MVNSEHHLINTNDPFCVKQGWLIIFRPYGREASFSKPIFPVELRANVVKCISMEKLLPLAFESRSQSSNNQLIRGVAPIEIVTGVSKLLNFNKQQLTVLRFYIFPG